MDSGETTKKDFTKRKTSIEHNILKIYTPRCMNKLESLIIVGNLKIGRTEDKIRERFNKTIRPVAKEWMNSTIESNDLQIVQRNFI